MLSHDMASFFNVAQSDALQDLKAILTGGAEPMKKYGVLMGENTVKAIAYWQGIARQGEKLTEVQKIQVVLQVPFLSNQRLCPYHLLH